jgi:cysteine synthase
MSNGQQLPGNVTYKNILDTIGNTPLVFLPTISAEAGVNIYAKLEGNNPTGSVKDRIAKYMMQKAEKDGLLVGKTILEPTSGNTGISLGLVCKLMGYKLTVVMPDNVSIERVQLLKAYGVEIIFSTGDGGTNNAIAVSQDIFEKNPDKYFMPYQYGNLANPLAHYETTGAEIIEALPTIDTFIAGLGTGGTLTGVGRRLKEFNSKIHVAAVVPNPDDSISGPILDQTILNSRIMIDSKEAFHMTKELLNKEGVFAGVSAGSVIACALKVAARGSHNNIVCLLADGGWKYLSANLWERDYNTMKDDIKGKLWW